MGHESTGRNRRVARAALGICATALFLCALAPSALAGGPFHARAKSLDIPNLNHACGVAVDSKGDVYASSAGTGKVKVYDPSHALLTEIADANTPCGLAVTTTGALYVSEKATGEVVRFKPNAYPFVGTPTYGPREVIDSSTKAKGIAVDRTDNRLYVAEGTKVAIYKADGSFEANVGEGTLTEATGVAAFTYSFNSASVVTERYLWVADAAGADHLDLFRGQSVGALKLRRELTGSTTPDGSFGFGVAGAYLAEDPGNRNSEGGCVVVGEQACTAGHLFLYDAAHKALDELDASGEYLDQAKNAAFTEAGAEPTAVALDRSGGSTDGTIYVTAGAGADAEALAFEALKAPSRAVLGTPLSHILAGAKAVATDSHGYVYVGAESAIHIYKPNGAEVLSIEDPSKPKDLAVDSTGKVYVLDDGEKLFASEREVTYYAPSAYPPLAGTAYTRRAEPIAIPEDFPAGGNLLRAIAVDPGPGPGKDRLFLTSNGATHLYDSAANESELLSEEFAMGIVGGRQSLAVNGANGTVYIATNTQGIWAVNETGTEVLARFLATGSTKTKANPYVAVDQANGHVVEFDETHGAREYDAAGAFVAEFGNFTEGMGSNYRVAVDSACATHEPPLTGAACEAYDPANGTAYVAYDDPNPNHPPYDVNAFGGLTYGTPPVVSNFKLTVKKTGSGFGKVTSSPAGIDCGSACEAEYEEGTEVTLSATPNEGSTFGGWSGSGCSGTGICKVTMSEAREVTASFEVAAKPKFALTVSKLGVGSGTVTSSPAGINCGSECSAEFEEGSTVTLNQSATSGSEFRGWTGACSGTGVCEVTMSEAKSVTARFANAKQVLTIAKAPAVQSGNGNGTVSSKPKGIKCAVACSVAKASLYKNAVVELTAKPAGESTFTGWSGCDTEAEGKCTVTMTEAKSITATFGNVSKVIPEAKALTALKAGTGEGTVKASGLACEAACSETQVLYQGEITSPKLKPAKTVELSATPAYGSSFTGWSGSGCSGTGTCTVSMATTHTVTASFAAKAPKTLVITKNSYETGTGTVSSKPKGLKCGPTCTTQAMSVPQGEKVILTEKPASGMEFEGWEGGGCSGTSPTCEVTVSTDTTVKAKFKPISTPPKAIANPRTLTLSKTGDGTGYVKAPGLACEAACTTATSLYTGGVGGLHPKPAATVTLEAIPSAGSALTSWSGCDSEVPGEPGKPSKCVVMTTATKEVTATFDQ